PAAIDLVGKILTISSGPGAGDTATIVDYDAETRTYTLHADAASIAPWVNTPPDNTSKYDISFSMPPEHPPYKPMLDIYKVVLTAQPSVANTANPNADPNVYVTVTPTATRAYDSSQAFNPDANNGESNGVRVEAAATRALVDLTWNGS